MKSPDMGVWPKTLNMAGKGLASGDYCHFWCAGLTPASGSQPSLQSIPEAWRGKAWALLKHCSWIQWSGTGLGAKGVAIIPLNPQEPGYLTQWLWKEFSFLVGKDFSLTVAIVTESCSKTPPNFSSYVITYKERERVVQIVRRAITNNKSILDPGVVWLVSGGSSIPLMAVLCLLRATDTGMQGHSSPQPLHPRLLTHFLNKYLI